MITLSVEVTNDDLKRLGRELQKAVGVQLAKRQLDAGAYARKVVQNSMRSRARRFDAPSGSPPFAHEVNSRGKTQSKNLKTEMRHIADPSTKSVVVGALAFSSSPEIPALHEFGGSITIGNPRRRERKLGDGGEIEVLSPGATETTYYDSRGRRRKARRKTAKWVNEDERDRRVIYAKLRTSAQVRRANEFNALLYGDWTEKETTYPARPYIAPALERVRSTGKFDDVLGDAILGV